MNHVTYKEILSQPAVWTKVADIVQRKQHELQEFLRDKRDWNAIFIGCGTSYYLALSAAKMYSKVTERRAWAASASDTLFYPEIIFSPGGNEYIPILISRSGETTEIVRAAEKIKARLGAHTCGVSCRPASDLARISSCPLVVPDANEKSVVMTRSFTSMLLLLQHLAGTLAGNAAFEEELLALPEKGATVLDTYLGLVKDIIDTSVFNKFVYLGQGPFYGLACEGMLKMKEMSLSFSEAYHTLEFRHGPMSIVDEDMLIILFISEHARAEELALLKEMKRLGAKTLVITEEADVEIQKAANYMVELKSGLSDYARLILYMPVVQLLGYYAAVAKGLNPDKPKNLTQVVVLNSDTS